MSRIRSRDAKPEMLVRRFLHGKGSRFRLHVRDLPGRPDLALPKIRFGSFRGGVLLVWPLVPEGADIWHEFGLLANQAGRQ